MIASDTVRNDDIHAPFGDFEARLDLRCASSHHRREEAVSLDAFRSHALRRHRSKSMKWS